LSSPKLSIIVGVCGRIDVLQKFIATTLMRCVHQNEVIFVCNGCAWDELQEIDRLTRTLGHSIKFGAYFEEPRGSIEPLNVGIIESTGEYLAMPHSDMLIHTDGWDDMLINFLDSNPRAGLVGITGAKIIGSRDIYSVPYEIRQLRRFDVWSSLTDWRSHTWMTSGGGHAVQPTSVVVLDGQFMACRRSDYNDFGPLDEDYVHHMYDNDLSLKFHYAGKTNYVLPIVGEHLSGQTANYPRYQEWAKDRFGDPVAGVVGDAWLHKQAHERFYARWRGRLPAIAR